MPSLSSYECNLKTMTRGLFSLWLLFLLGILWARSIFTLFILSLTLICYVLFPCINPRFNCHLLLQRPLFSNYFFKNCPLSSITFPLFCITDRLRFLYDSISVTYISVYRFKFFQVNFVRMFYTSLKIIELSI